MPWPPPPDRYLYAVGIQLTTESGALAPPLPEQAVVLVGASGSVASPVHWNPNYVSGLFDWRFSNVPAGLYRVRLQLPRAAHADSFTIWIDPETGQIIRDPLWTGTAFPPNDATRPRLATVRVPADLWAYLAIALDCPAAGATGITDGHLWAGTTPLHPGPAADTPPPLERYHHGPIAPGAYALRLEHPRYRLPAGTPPVLVSASSVAMRLQVEDTAPPPVFQIRGTAFYLARGETAHFTAAPAPGAQTVRWSSSAPSVLPLVSPDGTFQGASPGDAVISAQHGTQQATATVTVTAAADTPVLRPYDPKSVVHDSSVDADVVQGEVLVRFRDGVPAADQMALADAYGLSRIGVLPAMGLMQLAYDPGATSLKGLLDRLATDGRVAVASPNVPLQKSAVVPAFAPPELTTPADYWHLRKIEALPAFEILNQLPNRPAQSIVFIDSGLWETANREFSKDLTNRVDLQRSVSVLSGEPRWGLDAVRDSEFPYHGNRSATVAAAAWNGFGIAGIDPTATVVMVRTGDSAAQMVAGYGAALSALNAATRVVSVITSCAYPAKEWTNSQCRDIVKQIVHPQKGNAVVVIAAANNNDRASWKGVVTIAEKLDADERQRIVVVGGTAVKQSAPDGVEVRWNGSDGGSNYDAPGEHVVDVCAPAGRITALGANDVTGPISGTSESAPMVAGIAAALFSVLPPGEPAAKIKDILVKTADPIDEVDPQAPPWPQPLLQTEPGKGLGAGRVNYWQALLYALNEAPGTRWLGLRVTADVANLELSVVYAAGAEEHITTPRKTCVLADPQSTDAFRATMNDGGGAFPLFLSGRAPGPSGRELVRVRLPIEPAHIQQLDGRYVLTRILYTRGELTLTLEPPPAQRNQAAFTITNTGTSPDLREPDLLDPTWRRKRDKSLREWMKLQNGDAYTLRANAAQAPPGLTLEFLDDAQQPLPASQTDDEGGPYVVVLFGRALKLRLRGNFPPNAVNPVDVEIEVWSLNNALRKKTIPATIRPTQSPFRIKSGSAVPTNGPGWQCWQVFVVTYIGAEPPEDELVTMEAAAAFNGQDWRAWIEFNGRFAHSGQSQELKIVGFTSSTGTRLTANVNLTSPIDAEAHEVRSEFVCAGVDLALQCDAPYATRVYDGGGSVAYADFALVLTNRSPMPVMLHEAGFSADMDELPTTLPAGHAVAALQGQAWTGTPEHIVLQPGTSAGASLRLFYDRRAIYPTFPETRTGVRWVTIRAYDPASTTAPATGWNVSNALALRTYLFIPPA